jgi:polyferredoxin
MASRKVVLGFSRSRIRGWPWVFWVEAKIFLVEETSAKGFFIFFLVFLPLVIMRLVFIGGEGHVRPPYSC